MEKKITILTVIFIGIFIEALWIAGMVSGPTFIRLLNLSHTQLGIALGSLSVGMIFISPVAGQFVHKAGAGIVLMGGLAGTAAGVAVVIFAFNFVTLLTGMILMGITLSLVTTANMVLLVNLFPDKVRRIVSLYSALYFAAGALAAVSIGRWLGISWEKGWAFLSFRLPYFIALLVLVCVTILVRRIVIPFVLAEKKREKEHAAEPIPSRGAKAQQHKYRWLWIPAMFFFHGLMYIILIAWLGPMAHQKFGATEFQGSLLVGITTLGIAIGRLFIAFFRLPGEDREILAAGNITGGILFLAGLMAPTFNSAIILIGAGGLVASTSYPCISSLAGKMFNDMTAKVFGYMFSSYALAGVIGPALVGVLGDTGMELWKAVIIAPAASCMIGILSLLWKYTERNQPAAAGK